MFQFQNSLKKIGKMIEEYERNDPHTSSQSTYINKSLLVTTYTNIISKYIIIVENLNLKTIQTS